MEQCCICLIKTSAIHWHHTIPQALGGTDSLQIPVCGDCHTTLHKKADNIFAFENGGKKQPLLKYWNDPEDERRAERWLNVLLSAMRNPPVADGEKLTLLPSLKIDGERHSRLKLLKSDLKAIGITNMSATLLYCIDYTLRSKGLYNVEQENKEEATSNKGNGTNCINSKENHHRRFRTMR